MEGPERTFTATLQFITLPLVTVIGFTVGVGVGLTVGVGVGFAVGVAVGVAVAEAVGVTVSVYMLR